MRYLIIIAVLLCACRTARNVQKFTKQVDSTGFFKKDSTRVVRTDSVAVGNDKIITTHTDSADYEEWTVIEEYNDTPVVKKTTIHIRDKGVRKSKVVVVAKDSTATHKVDSGTVKSSAVVRKITDESGKDLHVKKTQGGVWWNLLLIIGLLLAAWWVYRKYIKPRLL